MDVADFERPFEETFPSIASLRTQAESLAILRDIICTEMVQNILTKASRKIFLRIIEKLRLQGVQGVIWGCTEIPLLIRQGDVDVPLFDTTAIHCAAAVAFAVED